MVGVEHEQAEAIVRTMIAVSDAGRKDLATKVDLARLELSFARLEAKFDATINKMLRNQIAVAGVLLVALKLL